MTTFRKTRHPPGNVSELGRILISFNSTFLHLLLAVYQKSLELVAPLTSSEAGLRHDQNEKDAFNGSGYGNLIEIVCMWWKDFGGLLECLGNRRGNVNVGSHFQERVKLQVGYQSLRSVQ